MDDSPSGLTNPAVRPASDEDPQETQEWLEALASVHRSGGSERSRFLLEQLALQARELGATPRALTVSAYQNTIPAALQTEHPGDVEMEERIAAMVRWNALAMVMRANRQHPELGGHIATYASAAEIFETGFNHFFRAGSEHGCGDLVYFQPHSAPGIYARAYLEGRLSEEQLSNFRRETAGQGLSSYPHPWLMPSFWEFPTGSMGIGPISAVYQAHFMRYLAHRGLAATAERHVWGIFGDGEMDEPESTAALTLAAREQLDNLTFIINCNLQRLDGPVRGNGQVIQEFEALFTGAGWNVIKVLWGSDWDPLFASDTARALLREFATTVDGEYQTLGANDGSYNREHFFERSAVLRELVAHLSVRQIDALKRGGHDFRKLYAAFSAALAHKGRPTVILAKTKKGYGMGRLGESRNVSHQQKKLDEEALVEFGRRFALPLTEAELRDLRFLCPPHDSAEMRYLRQRRASLGGALPKRLPAPAGLTVPPIGTYAKFALESNDKEMSTTMAFVRLLTGLLHDKSLGPRIVPIVADEARTFGMASLFRQLGIYSPVGQLYAPEDAGSLMAYREARNGQLLEEGITEAGALSSWIAAATSYSAHKLSMLPFYIFYSMFGFQRVGDLLWAAADQRSRGFLIGATSGRTTLSGEGLQHQDGASQLLASTIPTCRAYDPAFAYEAAVIIDHGARCLVEKNEDLFYYLTVTNENYAQPSLPSKVEEGIVRGMYRFRGTGTSTRHRVRLLGSGAILREVIAAADLLAADWTVETEVWSVTSFTELAREAREIERWNRLHPTEPARCSYVSQCLEGNSPIVAATDYVCAYPQLIAPFLEARLTALGTDGFGRSDTRAALRRFFEVDRHHIVLAALHALAHHGAIDKARAAAAIQRYRLDADSMPPWLR